MSLELGKRISASLKQQNLTQRELADRIFVAEATMSRYINGERVPKPDVLADIARELKTSTDYLLGIEPDEYIHTEIVQIIRTNAQHMSKEQRREILNALLGE